jgi:DNA processing protein
MTTRPELLRLAHAALAPATVDRLLSVHGSPAAVVDAIGAGITSVSEWGVAAVGAPASTRERALEGLGVVFVDDRADAYPGRLRRYPDRPRWLFIDGSIPTERPSIAIVGTRTCTEYGRELAMAYGVAAAEAGWSVVSGLARGIDRAAHDGAVAAGGHAIAVLGSGIDVVYPRSNRGLHAAILASGGCVCSEFPPGTRPDAWRFPTRNRIIAGLSDAVLVVEAGERGGALITARIAADYGLPVFATPGDIDRPVSAGTNALIRDGAFPVFGADDLRRTLELLEGMVSPASVGS